MHLYQNVIRVHAIVLGWALMVHVQCQMLVQNVRTTFVITHPAILVLQHVEIGLQQVTWINQHVKVRFYSKFKKILFFENIVFHRPQKYLMRTEVWLASVQA